MSVVVFFFDLVEGKDQPQYKWKPEFKVEYGATGGLMMRTTKPLFGKGKAVVTDSGFCVLKGLVEMLSHGLCGTTVLRKKRYQPK